MTNIDDIIRHVKHLSGHGLNEDEGIQHGNGDREVSGVTISWMASPDAIQVAGEAGHELLISHESLYYPYDVINASSPPDGWEEWKVNKQRRSFLEKHQLSFLRLHGSVDEICIFDVFAEMLGLGSPVFAERLVKVYEIAACPLHALVESVKDRMGISHVRVACGGDMERMVSRVGLPWGGLGLFVNVGYQQSLVAQGCDVFIAGESDNYGFRFALESGIPMIETSHEVSENPGLRRFTSMLNEAFPNVSFAFYENDCVWRMR